MPRIHATFIALVIAAAGVAGLYAATKTVQLGQKAAAPSVSARDLATRQAKLDAWSRTLRATLAKRPPALPKLPHFAPLPAQASPAPSVATAQPRVAYVQPPAVVKYERAAAARTTTSRSDDGSGDDGSEGGD